MPAGLECYEDDGTTSVSIIDRIPKILGTIETGIQPGSITIPEFSQGIGIPWVVGCAYNKESINSFPAKVYLEGALIRWDFEFPNPYYPPPFSRRASVKIFYGIR